MTPIRPKILRFIGIALILAGLTGWVMLLHGCGTPMYFVENPVNAYTGSGKPSPCATIAINALETFQRHGWHGMILDGESLYGGHFQAYVVDSQGFKHYLTIENGVACFAPLDYWFTEITGEFKLEDVKKVYVK